MKKVIASLVALIGAACAAPQPAKVERLNPQSIHYTMPTISEDVPEIEKVITQPGPNELVFHEDEWCQIEFFPKSRLPEIQRILTEYKPFEISNREQGGWREIYMRRITRVAVIAGPDPVARLESALHAKAGPAPILRTSSAIVGGVKNGFTVPLGGNISLYGYLSAGAIPVLGANVGKDPDDSKLTEAFRQLNASYDVILVDWRAQLVLLSIGDDGQAEVWRL
jgi:hypothetical protein